MNDDQLHQLLRGCPARISLPNSFNRKVWARIESSEPPSLSSAVAQVWRSWITTLARPAPAFATVALCMLLGGGFGWMSQNATSGDTSELAYVASINPFMRTKHEVKP